MLVESKLILGEDFLFCDILANGNSENLKEIYIYMFIKNKVVTVANVFGKPEKLVANLKNIISLP